MERAKHSTKGNSHTPSTVIGETIREIGHRLDAFSKTAASRSDEMIHRGNSMASHAQNELGRYTDTVVNYVQGNPVKSILIAGGIGLLLAKLLKSRPNARSI